MANRTKHGALVMTIEARDSDPTYKPKRYHVFEDGVILWEIVGIPSLRVIYRPTGVPAHLRRDAAMDVLHEKWDELEARGYVVRAVKEVSDAAGH